MIKFRHMKPADRKYVVDSWMRSYSDAHAAGLILDENYPRVMIEQIEALLDKPSVRTVIAYDPDEDSGIADINGWICAVTDTPGDVPLVLYVNVKGPYRRRGYARALFKAVGVDPDDRFDMGCKTAVCTTLARKIPRARFNPGRARSL